MKVKMCGLYRPEDIDYDNEVQPDYVGFVFAPSRRQISKEQAEKFKQQLLLSIQTVGVFVNAPVEEVIAYLMDGIIDIAQLHGDETEEDIRYIKAVTKSQVIKAVKVQCSQEVEAWLDSEADYLLFDSGAGSGKIFDWQLLGDVNRDFFLAGGLRPDNLEEAMKRVPAFAVDISSGVETDGVKDLAKMQAAVQIVRGYIG